MSERLLRRGGLALRIYLVSVTAVLAVAVALFLTARMARDPIHPLPVRELGTYASYHLGAVWSRQDAVRKELGLATRGARAAALERPPQGRGLSKRPMVRIGAQATRLESSVAGTRRRPE